MDEKVQKWEKLPEISNHRDNDLFVKWLVEAMMLENEYEKTINSIIQLDNEPEEILTTISNRSGLS